MGSGFCILRAGFVHYLTATERMEHAAGMTLTGTSYLDELNAAQREAATCAGGPVLVIAGAGTGKTKTLACRVAWLIGQGVAAERIMLLTFTRRAAAEMLSRAGKIIAGGAGATAKVWGGTFHATANRLLRQYGRALGLAPEFTVMDAADAADTMALIRSDQGVAKKERRFPSKTTLAGIYSRMVNARMKLSELVERQYPWVREDIEGIRQIFAGYTRRKREQNVLDYDDLLLYWKALLDVPGVGETVAGRFEHVLVDEYQDTNVVQAEILLGMRRTNKNIMVVGDDAQSIYSFRAATVRNILDFPAQFSGDGASGGARIIKLEENYRSVQPILDASNAVMAQATERYTKNLFSKRVSAAKPAIVTCLDEAEQCSEVAGRIVEFLEQGIPLRRQAVLFRAGHHSDLLEVELTRRNVPFVKYGGLKFIEAAHIKDMLAMLRLMENPADEISWFRVLLLLNGVGPVTAERMMGSMGLRRNGAEGEAVVRPGMSVVGMLASASHVPEPAREEFGGLRKMMEDCVGRGVGGTAGAEGRELPPGAMVERVRKFYEPIFRRIYENPQVRLRDLEQLELIAGQYKSRSAFITDLTLDPPQSTQDLAGPPLLEEDWTTLSTIHSAKGMEWDVVHILHVADGMIPSDMATGTPEEVDEERRLLYVAMTRAKDRLFLYFPLRYYRRQRGVGDAHTYAQLTRFIPEAAAGSLFERLTGKQVHAEQELPGAGAAGVKGSAKAVDEMLRDLMGG